MNLVIFYSRLFVDAFYRDWKFLTQKSFHYPFFFSLVYRWNLYDLKLITLIRTKKVSKKYQSVLWIVCGFHKHAVNAEKLKTKFSYFFKDCTNF